MKKIIGDQLRSNWRYLPMFTSQGCNFGGAESIVPRDDIEDFEHYNSPSSELSSKHAHNMPRLHYQETREGLGVYGRHCPKAKLSMSSLSLARFPKSWWPCTVRILSRTSDHLWWTTPHGTYTFRNRRLLVVETVELLQ